MDSVKLKRTDVLDRVKENRKTHEKIYKEAVVGFRKAAVKALKKALKDAEGDKPIVQTLGLIEPQSHLDEYDRVIDMLEMSVEDEITLDAYSFNKYMRDEWDWKRQFITSNSSYSATAAGVR